MKKPTIVVYRLGKEAPVRFAAGELARYLSAMTGRTVKAQATKAYQPGKRGIWLGAGDAFGDVVPGTIAGIEHPFDDAVFVQAEGGHAVVTGANARSVVFAVYRYLEELGCRWLRPGRHGERVPGAPDAAERTVQIEEVPSMRHRCICIEGSCSREHVRDLIDYAAKRGLNSYYLQFFTSYTFFQRWYGVERHRGEAETPFTRDEALRSCDAVKRRLAERGMIVHRVGHGWTAEPFGIEANEWAPSTQSIPAATKTHLAQVDGERGLHNGIALNTQLCLSNPATRARVVRAIADYSESHPDEEVIHVWLADGMRNFCECDGCAPRRPSDWYVVLLFNEIDAALTARGIPTRIVFLAYVDLLWGPDDEVIANPERFILMFAPITRSYTTSLLGAPETGEELPAFALNDSRMPSSPRANLDLLASWERAFRGDMVDFDYHLIWDPKNDPGTLESARVLFEDCRDLARMGMNGFISCQLTRVSFPTGLAMHAMGKALWDSSTKFRPMARDYFADVFEGDGPAVMKYLSGLTRLFDPAFLRREKRDEAATKKAVANLRKVAAHVEAFLPTVEAGCRSDDAVTAAAWRLMREHADYVRHVAGIYAHLYGGGGLRAFDLYLRYDRWLDRRLPHIHEVFDVFNAKGVMRRDFANAEVGLSYKFILADD